MKSALKIGEKITLNEIGTDKQTVFTIKEVIGIGASCIVYTAVYTDGEGNTFSVRLKEFYPEGTDIQRNGTSLDISDTERFSAMLSFFTSGYQKQLEFRNNSEQMNSISNVQGVYTGNNTRYIAMSCNNGSCINEDDEFTFTDIMRITAAVTRQIKAFHQNGYLYLDLKPNNIFLYPETPDMVMLFDFDSVISKENVRKHSEWLSYTEEWSAPELSRNQISKIDERADIYSIGALLLFLLFRRKPTLSDRRRFASWEEDIAKSVLSSESPETVRMVTNILQKTLTSSVSGRYESCDEILEVTDGYISRILAPKPYLNTFLPMGNNYFCGRDKEIAEIGERLKSDTFLVLHGIGGIGKSELAKHYALKYADSYDAVIFTRYSKSIRDTLLSDTNFPIINCKQAQDEDDDSYFERKLHILQSVCTSRHLIILDNFDTEECDDLEYLTGLQCKVIATSRVNYSDVFAQIDIDVLSDASDMYKLVTHYYQYDTDDEEDQAVYDIISAVQGHTMALELIAKHMQNMEIPPVEMRELLAENGIVSGDNGKVRNLKDGKLKSKTAYAHIATLFSIFGLSEEMKQMLRYFALLGPYTIEAGTFGEFTSFGEEDIEVLDSLIANGWVQEIFKEDDVYVSTHPLICDVLCNELKPDIEHCEEFILSSEYMTHMLVGQKSENRKIIFLCLDHIAHNIYGDSTAIVCFFYALSSVYMEENEYDNARWCYKRNIEILHNINEQDNFKLELLKCYKELRNIDSLFEKNDDKDYYEKKIEELGTPVSLIESAKCKWEAAMDEYDYAKAKEYSEISLEIALKLNDSIHISDNYSQLGETEDLLGDSEKSVEYYRKASDYICKAIEKWENNEEECYDGMLGNLYRRAGFLNRKCCNYEEAIEYYKKAVRQYDEDFGENNAETGETYNLLADLYMYMKDYDNSIECCRKSISAFEKIYGQNHTETLEIYNAFIRICQDAWSEKRDISYLKSEEEILFKIVEANSAVYGERSSIVAGNYLDYSVICREYEDKEKCSDYMQKAYDVFSDSLEEDDEWWIYIHLGMADNYKFLGDMKTAYDKLEKALEKSKASGDEDLVHDIQKMQDDLKKSL